MEVHHHTHSQNSSAGHSGKKFKHYFFEFFMLFLAVFCGFLAENQREHIVEHKRGMQYIRSFVEDLKIDTARFTGTIRYYEESDLMLAPLYLCYDSILHNQNATGSLINILWATDGFADLIYTDRTLQQLKNAGGLRLLEERDADSIIRYDAFLRYVLKVESTSMQEKANQLRNTRNAVFVFSEIMDTTFGKKVLGENIIPAKLEVVTRDKDLLNRFFNEVLVYRGASRYMYSLIIRLRERAAGLIEFFTQKYHLN